MVWMIKQSPAKGKRKLLVKWIFLKWQKWGAAIMVLNFFL